MEKFIVTGSYLPQAANSIAIPVISLDASTILNSGSNDVLEILRKTAPEFAGNGNLGSSNANISSGATAGGAQVALRNATTLVLVNGRRMAYSPASSAGGLQFVDVNLIPVAAIERIEVLADGASAIYGTDAVSGVVNIILKTNYEGFEMGSRYGWATSKGHAAQRSAYVVGGASNGKTSVTLSAEWLKVDPIFNYERPYSDPTYGTSSFAGAVNDASNNYYYLDPAKNAPTVTAAGLAPAALVANGTYAGPKTAGDMIQYFNLSQYVTQTVQNERQSLSLAFDHKVSDNLKGFGDVLYSHTNTFSQINGQPLNSSNATSGALATLTPTELTAAGIAATGTTRFYIPAGKFGNPFNIPITARNRLVNHPREYLYDTTGIRATAGLTGEIPGMTKEWNWEVGATYNRISMDYQNPGVINNKLLAQAILNGTFNFFAREQTPGSLESAGIVGIATGGFISTLSNLDAKIRGSLFDLPGGPLEFAVGGEIRKESLSAVADPLSMNDPITGVLGWNGATTYYPFDANRRVGALFAEVRAPVAKGLPGAHYLEFSGAVRHEYYSDTSNPTVPKVTFRYLPVSDDFAFRGTYSKSFSAPQLYSMFGPVSIGYTSAVSLTRLNGTVYSNYQANSMGGSNPALQPAKSKNYTLGFVYSPKAIRGFSASIDYWNIKQTDLVSSIPASNILNDVEKNGTAAKYAGYVHFNSFTGPLVTAPGQLGNAIPDNVYVVNNNVNIAKMDLDGFDFAARYDFDIEAKGHISLATNIGIYNHFTHVDVPGDAAQETVGKSTLFNGTIPRWQSYTTIDFKRDNYNAFVGWRSIPKVTDAEDDTTTSSFNTFDVSVGYRFGPEIKYLNKVQLTVGVNNVFNKWGPQDPTVFSDANVDTATYGSWGRFIYIDLKYKF